MNKNQSQKILKSSTLERIKGELRFGSSLGGYFKESYLLNDTDLWPSNILVQGKIPELSTPEKDLASTDIDNAITLYEYYGDLDETQASDPRLWTYLSHIGFRKYTLARWGLSGTLEDLKDPIKKSKAITYLFEHWFVGGNDRDLRRHAVARLWWAAHLTRSPWESDPDFFGELKKDDPYYYTRILLSTQDIYQQVLERAMGRSNHILISVLDYLANNPDFARSREKIRTLMKELNLAYGTKKIITLNHEALKSLVEKIGAGI